MKGIIKIILCLYLVLASCWVTAQNNPASCVNGDFEDVENILNTYQFGLRTGNNFECNTPAEDANSNWVEVNENDVPVSIINRNAAGFVPFMNVYNGNQVPVISPNGGDVCIKLNPSLNTFGGVTTMHKAFTVGANDDYISYDFSLFLQRTIADHHEGDRPAFIVELVVGGQVEGRKCYNADDCIFTLGISPSSDRNNDVFYTGWRSDRFDVSRYRGQNATIRFTATSCGFQASNHTGTAYIDNVCGVNSANPVAGFLSINPLNDCNLLDSQTFQICGEFATSLNTAVNSIALALSQNNGTFNQVAVTPVITGNTYCFNNLPISLLGVNPELNEYEFRVTATVLESPQVSCDVILDPLITFDQLNFENCGSPCVPTLTLVSTTDDVNNNDLVPIKWRKASNWIKATNTVSFGNANLGDGVVYRANNFVELNPGFQTISGAQFSAFIQECVDNNNDFVYRTQNPGNDYEIKPVKSVVGKFNIYPNPSSNYITVDYVVGFNQVRITSIDGKTVFNQKSDISNSKQIDVANFKNGIYTLSIVTADGNTLTEKLIKN